MSRRTPDNCDDCVDCCQGCACLICKDSRLGGLDLDWNGNDRLHLPEDSTPEIMLRVGKAPGGWTFIDNYTVDEDEAGGVCSHTWFVVSNRAITFSRYELKATSTQVYFYVENLVPKVVVSKFYELYETFPTWISGTYYNIGDSVIYNGKAYRCSTGHLSSPTLTPVPGYGPPYGGDGSPTRYWREIAFSKTLVEQLVSKDLYHLECDLLTCTGATEAVLTYEGTTNENILTFGSINPVSEPYLDPPFGTITFISATKTCCDCTTIHYEDDATCKYFDEDGCQQDEPNIDINISDGSGLGLSLPSSLSLACDGSTNQNLITSLGISGNYTIGGFTYTVVDVKVVTVLSYVYGGVVVTIQGYLAGSPCTPPAAMVTATRILWNTSNGNILLPKYKYCPADDPRADETVARKAIATTTIQNSPSSINNNGNQIRLCGGGLAVGGTIGRDLFDAVGAQYVSINSIVASLA